MGRLNYFVILFLLIDKTVKIPFKGRAIIVSIFVMEPGTGHLSP